MKQLRISFFFLHSHIFLLSVLGQEEWTPPPPPFHRSSRSCMKLSGNRGVPSGADSLKVQPDWAPSPSSSTGAGPTRPEHAHLAVPHGSSRHGTCHDVHSGTCPCASVPPMAAEQQKRPAKLIIHSKMDFLFSPLAALIPLRVTGRMLEPRQGAPCQLSRSPGTPPCDQNRSPTEVRSPL